MERAGFFSPPTRYAVCNILYKYKCIYHTFIIHLPKLFKVRELPEATQTRTSATSGPATTGRTGSGSGNGEWGVRGGPCHAQGRTVGAGVPSAQREYPLPSAAEN